MFLWKVMRVRWRAARFAALALVLSAACAQSQDDIPMRAMKDELARSAGQLRLQEMDKPYFLAYRMDEANVATISASLGSLTSTQPLRMRMIGVEVRVGDYALDNSNFVSLRSLGAMAGMFSAISQASLDDNYEQIRREFWLATDRQYKRALEDLSAKRAVLQTRRRSDEVPDFSKESPVSGITSEHSKSAHNTRDLEALARELSAVFHTTPEIFASSVDIEYRDLYTRYANSEGSSFTRSQPILKLQVNAETQAPSGLPISESVEFFGRTPADLPPREVMLERTRELAARILKLRSAASVERYNGPVLFEDAAAGEIFSQQFAGGLMAVRTPLGDDPRFEAFFNQMMSQLGGASYADKIGGRVLPELLSLRDDPTQSEYQGTKLLGAYRIDDDAVPARSTILVEHGVLKTLLASRIPVRAVPHSTGNRRGWGAVPSNLILSADKGLSRAELRQEALRRAKERGLEYAVVVRRVGGGGAASFMRMAARMAPRGGIETTASLAEVYKLFPDGREELMQGMEIAEMTPASFKEIVAVGNAPVVYTDEFMPKVGALFAMGIAGGTDMPVVSVVAPSLLFDEVSLAQSQGPFPNPPVTPSPLAKQ